MGILLKKYAWALNLFFIFLGTYFLAKMTSTWLGAQIRIPQKISARKISAVSPNAKQRVSFEDYRIILERNIFDSRELTPEEIVTETTPPPQENLEGPAVKTSLPIKLISTVSVGDGTDKRSSATISGGKGGEETYSIGGEEKLSPGVELKKILPDRIEFVNNRRLEYAEIESFGATLRTGRSISDLEKPSSSTKPTKKPSEVQGVQEAGEGKFIVDRREIDSALENMDKLFTQIRAVPQFKGGKTSGLKLLSVRRGSLFAKLGLKRNDVLERINGQEVDLQKGMELFNQLKDSNKITIDLKRRGKATSLEYDIQ